MKYKILIILSISILLIFGIGITYSVFHSSLTLSSNDQNIARFVFNAKNLDQLQLPLIDLNPGDKKEYSFSVSNNNSGTISNVAVEYQMTIKTYHLVPLIIELYKLNGADEELISTCDETHTRDSQNELVCDIPKEEMGYSSQEFDNYKLKIEFPIEYNDLSYSDLVDYLNIEIKSWQRTGNDGPHETDNTSPIITLFGDNPITVNAGDVYKDAGVTATDDKDGDITSRVSVVSSVNTSVLGTYTVTYNVSDSSGNAATQVTRTVNVLDGTLPVVTFGTNGNSTYGKTRSITVTVSDNVEVDTNNLKYQWTTSTVAPIEDSFTSTFINGDSITTPVGVTGSYYLWILAKDTSGNTSIQRSNVFNLDNIIPVITMNGSSPVNISLGDTYTDAGATASDNIDGNIAVQATSDVFTSIAGTYTVTYTVSDTAGNSAIPVVRTINVISEDISGPSYIASKGVNGPVLATGMVPIKWDGSTWVDTTVRDQSWYNYDTTNKQWANARTADGSMWVWIPRYAYKISSSNYHTKTAGAIDIKFLMDTTNTTSDSTSIYNDNASNTYFVKQPAFTFGSTELTGIWVAKFETSGTSSIALDSKPGATTYTNTSLKNMFTYTRNMEIRTRYGWGLSSGTMNADGTFPTDSNGVDTHVMKNIEWGAVVYITHSLYGKNGSLANGGCTTGYTGCGPGTTYVTRAATSSTSGNIYGIYDMSGGAYDYVMGNYDNIAQSGPTPSSLNDKYIDRYSATNYGYDNSKWGDAIYETSFTACTQGLNPGNCLNYSWYSSKSYMTYSSSAWLERGGSNTAGDIGIFAFLASNGGSSNTVSWHIVLLAKTGL